MSQVPLLSVQDLTVRFRADAGWMTAVEDVANLTDQQIESPDNARVGRMANPLFRGVARLNECAVILLDASRILQ